jgi:hypothetical protein
VIPLILLAMASAADLAAAVEAQPDRPGLRIAYVHALVREARPDEGLREARAVVRRWPASRRAQIALAAAAHATGDADTAIAALRTVAAGDDALAATASSSLRRLEQAARDWGVRGVVGVDYDSRAHGDELPLRDDDPGEAAARARLGVAADARWALAKWRLGMGFGAERTAHLAAADSAGDNDRGLLWGRLRSVRTGTLGVVGLSVEGRGALSGRVGDPHHVGGGLGAWWGRGVSPFSPWLEVRGLGYRFGEAAGVSDTAWSGEVAVGATTHQGAWQGTLRLSALEVVAEDAGFTEPGADVGLRGVVRGATLGLRGGVGWRALESWRPRAAADARLPLTDRVALLARVHWRAAPEWQRFVAGVGVEVAR